MSVFHYSEETFKRYYFETLIPIHVVWLVSQTGKYGCKRGAKRTQRIKKIKKTKGNKSCQAKRKENGLEI